MLLTTLLMVTGLGIYPPINSVFAGRSKFLVGEQKVSLHVKSNKEALIDMKGIVNTQGAVKYVVKDDQTIDFVFSDAVSKVLKKFKCKIRHATYNPTNNVARVHLHIYNIVSHTMTLHNKNTNMGTS